jgi:DNA-binding CsgD family transcriptional regulator
VAQQTVKNQLHRAFVKLGVKSRFAAIDLLDQVDPYWRSDSGFLERIPAHRLSESELLAIAARDRSPRSNATRDRRALLRHAAALQYGGPESLDTMQGPCQLKLTTRELEVLRSSADETSTAIATRVGLTRKQVKFALFEAYRILGVHSRAAARARLDAEWPGWRDGAIALVKLPRQLVAGAQLELIASRTNESHHSVATRDRDALLGHIRALQQAHAGRAQPRSDRILGRDQGLWLLQVDDMTR